MSLVDERIAMLEALLARVRRRSHEPRGGVAKGTETNGIGAPEHEDVIENGSASNGIRPSASSASSAPEAFDGSDITAVTPPQMTWSSPIHAASEATPEPERAPADNPIFPAIRQPEASQSRLIEPPPMEVIELDIEPDPSMPPPPFDASDEERDDAYESRSRLVTAPPIASSDSTLDIGEPLDLPLDEPLVAAEEREARGHEQGEEDERDEEEEEAAPSSSRRPITVEEKLAQLAEDDDAHAPPPESGKLLATAIIDLDEPDVPAPRREDESAPRREETELSLAPIILPRQPEIARVTPPEADVASFVGKVTEARTPTFGDLLDASMRL